MLAQVRVTALSIYLHIVPSSKREIRERDGLVGPECRELLVEVGGEGGVVDRRLDGEGWWCKGGLLGKVLEGLWI